VLSTVHALATLQHAGYVIDL